MSSVGINSELQQILNKPSSAGISNPSSNSIAKQNIIDKNKTNSINSTEKDFLKVLQDSEQKKAKTLDQQNDPDSTSPVFSSHALKRIQERSISMDGPEFTKLKLALQKLENKGGQDSLVITDKAAYILDVGNKKVVTAMNKKELAENVFTKIDSTIFV